MSKNTISLQKSGYFSPIINDYLDQKPSLQSLYNRFPTIENFELQLAEKTHNYNADNRAILVDVLKNQYKNFEISDKTKQNIEDLLNENCFTVTTGHQLNLFTGPLYFLYKIISTINLCRDLKAKYPTRNFVPIYWMATEDHDFEEVNFFKFKDIKNLWKTKQSGAVGRFETKDIESVFDIFSNQIGTSIYANELKDLFQNAYLKHSNLADATRFLVNQLYGNHGLIILDGDNKVLKKQLAPYIKDELLNQSSYKFVTETISLLKDYKIQVNPREINLFYLTKNSRERIIFENNLYQINNTNIKFSETEMLQELENNPERFSPNVILRPLYQEVILPNLCYIGGGGELAYWLELKTSFDHYKVLFPILVLRNSALIATQKQLDKVYKLNLSMADLFLNQKDLIDNQTRKLSQFPIDFSEQKAHLQQQFEKLLALVNQTDKSFEGAVKAQEKKQLNGLENLEKRLLKAQKRKYFEDLEKIKTLQNELFSNQSLQERQANFSEFYLEYGFEFIDKLILELKPLEQNFNIIVL